MGIRFQNNQAIFVDVAGVDDAEGLLEWLQKNPTATADFSFCTHVHPANLQVLMAAGTAIKKWPQDDTLCNWLEPLCRAGPSSGIEKNCIEPEKKP